MHNIQRFSLTGADSSPGGCAPRFVRVLVVAGLSLLLGGCINDRIGPTVSARAGPAKTFEEFQQDMRVCMADSKARVRGQFAVADLRMIGTTAAGGIVSAGTAPAYRDGKHGPIVITPGSSNVGNDNNAAQFAWDARNAIQRNYDLLFSQCMLARGDEILGPPSQSDVAAPDK